MESTFTAHYEEAKIAGEAASLVGNLWVEAFGPDFNQAAEAALYSIRQYLYDRAEIAAQFAAVANALEYTANIRDYGLATQ
jgi:hypothetical protein